uniref:Uncharacterized protein n=1 Tax=Anguilla anguilla TaxID=7936 RepID=A0A0E9XID0_ANGAN
MFHCLFVMEAFSQYSIIPHALDRFAEHFKFLHKFLDQITPVSLDAGWLSMLFI